MRNGIFNIVVFVFLLVGNTSLVSAANFTDISESPYRQSIVDLSTQQVVSGYADGSFRPEWNVNRAELLKMIFTALDAELSEQAENCFSDVKQEWFAPYVCTATHKGFVKGYPDGRFWPGQEVNMVEALKMVLEIMEMPVAEAGDGEPWYAPYVAFSHRNNLFSQYSYLPGRFARREEVAFVINQIQKIRESVRSLQSKRDVGSPGCGQSIGPVPTRFMVNGQERTAITVVPEGYNPHVPTPIVFGFHGRTNSNAEVQRYYRIDRASGNSVFEVYPAGQKAGTGFNWSDGNDPVSALRDYEFFDVILENMMDKYCIDVDQVYVMGHSLGAWFSNSLACARGDVIRAVGTLGGARRSGECRGPVAAMQWHNPKDRLVSFQSAVNARESYRRQNACGDQRISIEPALGNCEIYLDCSQHSPLIWCPHTNDYASYDGSYYPHNWPRGTGQAIWNFWQSLD